VGVELVWLQGQGASQMLFGGRQVSAANQGRCQVVMQLGFQRCQLDGSAEV